MPWIEQRPHGWRIRYRIPGRKTIASLDGFPTKAAAEAHLATMTRHNTQHSGTRAAAEATAPRALPRETPTLREWIDTWWQALDVSPATEAQYRSLLTNHILPTWGDHPLTALSPIELHAWDKQLRRRYAHATATTIRKLLARILTDAVTEGLLTSNPVRRPRRSGHPRPARRRAVTATPAQILAFQDHLTCADFTLVVTAAYTGMRWGELTGLLRTHCHLDDHLIRIDPDHGNLHEVNGTLFLGPPKNGKGRDIALPPFLVDLLRTHLDTHNHPQVFTAPDGGWLRRSTFNRRVWRPACDGTPTPTPPNAHPRCCPACASTTCATPTRPG